MLTDGNICAQKKKTTTQLFKTMGNGYDFRDTALRISPAREFHSCLSVQGHLAFWKLWIGKYTVLLPRKRAQIALRNTEFLSYVSYRLMKTNLCFEVKSRFSIFFKKKTMDHVFRNVCVTMKKERINPTTPQNKQHQLHNSLSSCQYWYTSVPVTTAPQQSTEVNAPPYEHHYNGI